MQTNDDSFYNTPQKKSNTQCQHMFPHVFEEYCCGFFFRFGSATSEPVAIEWFYQLALLNFFLVWNVSISYKAIIDSSVHDVLKVYKNK